MTSLRLVPEEGGSPLTVEGDHVLIGRDAICELQLADVSVSRKHAEIRRDGGVWVLRDLNSANGVLVDGLPAPKSPLRSGQRLQFGTVGVRVEIQDGTELEGATVVLERPPARDKTPKAQSPRTTKAPSTHAVRPAPVPPPRRLGGATLVVAGLLIVVALGVAAWLRLLNPTEPRREVVRAKVAVPPVSEAKASSDAPAASAISGSPGTVEVTTDTEALVFIDGDKKTELLAGATEWIEVAPGEHVVTFGVGRLRRDVTVRVKANEQTVARFAGGSPSASASASASPRLRVPPKPRPTAVALSTSARARPQEFPARPLPLAPAATPAVEPHKAPPAFTDEGLARGAGLAARGDFYRAVLLLNDAVGRLQDDASGRPQLAYANAYLAWAYQGLNRTDEARAAADRAMRADPGIAGGLDAFPPPVLGLFKRTR